MHRIENAGKFRKYAVPGGAGNPIAVAQDRLVNNTTVSGQRRERLLLIGLLIGCGPPRLRQRLRPAYVPTVALPSTRDLSTTIDISRGTRDWAA
jgi:hypothetical protein